MVKNNQKLILSSNMYPNYPMKTLDSNSEKVGVSWSEDKKNEFSQTKI